MHQTARGAWAHLDPNWDIRVSVVEAEFVDSVCILSHRKLLGLADFEINALLSPARVHEPRIDSPRVLLASNQTPEGTIPGNKAPAWDIIEGKPSP